MQSQNPITKPREFTPDQKLVVWVLWLTYGSFYFCRNNLGVAVPGIMAEFGHSKMEMGAVLMGLKLAYGLGQVINGQLAERLSPTKLIATGMMASALLNVLFGWVEGLWFFIFVWAVNGYAQALGWTPCMKVASSWFDALHRGRAIGIIGTGYQLCGGLTYLVSGWAAESYGWRAALWIPAIILTLSSVHMLLFLKDAPESAREARAKGSAAALSLGTTVRMTLTTPALWVVAVTLCVLDACRYGFSDWGVTHLKEIQKVSVGSAALKYAVLPFGGIAGALVSGWMTDRFFAGRRAPMVVILMALLGCLTLAYDTVIHWGPLVSVSLLFAVGFCIFGSQVLLVGTLPVDLARQGTAAAAAGFVNFMGYMGAAGGDWMTGTLAERHGWPVAVRFWACCAFAGAIFISFLWNKSNSTS
ncbi:MAG: MFS transporter [Verrucomicrobiaceae bacterium]|nr:MFS transporter [Verrucomicrobiaceae bacterium]